MNTETIPTIPSATLNIPRSPYDTEGGIVYFPRMLEKIRLQAAGVLPETYQETLGKNFDRRCCTLLGVDFEELAAVVRHGLSDEHVLNWAFEHGNAPSKEQIEIWNAFMMKRGWRDETTPHLRRRLKDIGCEDHTEIQTLFDCIEFEENRPILHSLEQLVH